MITTIFENAHVDSIPLYLFRSLNQFRYKKIAERGRSK